MRKVYHVAWFWVLLAIILFVLTFRGCQRALPGEPIFGIPPGPDWSELGYKLILDFEVGGGKNYYERYLSHPTWPGYASGVTVGIGYDLGYSSPAAIHLDWWRLPFEERARLAAASHVTGRTAKLLTKEVRDIFIPWKIAQEVFHRTTVGRYWQLTLRAFPGADALCPEAQWALLSIVFNRGNDLTGARRREMRDIRAAVKRQDYRAIAAANRASCRVWTGTDIERGMQRRRFAESGLIERCL